MPKFGILYRASQTFLPANPSSEKEYFFGITADNQRASRREDWIYEQKKIGVNFPLSAPASKVWGGVVLVLHPLPANLGYKILTNLGKEVSQGEKYSMEKNQLTTQQKRNYDG